MDLPPTPRTSAPSGRPHRQRLSAFSLVEMLVVIGIMILMMGLAIPAFNMIKGGGDVTKAAYDIAGVLEQARTYAIANNTYVWVGFFEEDGATPSAAANAKPGTGRLIISVVASKDGTRYSDAQVDSSTPPAFGTESPTASPARNQVKLFALNKLMKIEGVHLGTFNNGSSLPNRPPVKTEYQMGDAGFAQHVSGASSTSIPNPTTFNSPLAIVGSSTTPQYTFAKIIEFNAQGEASKIVENTFSGPGLQGALEISFQPTHGNVIDPRYAGTANAAVAIQIEGITGQVKMYRL